MERGTGFEQAGFIKETKRRVERSTLDFLVKTYAEDFEKRGWEAIPDGMNRYLESLGVVPVYEKEEDPNFAEQRKRLNTEAGVVISNHPSGYIDVPIILSSIHREDFRAYVQENVYRGMLDACTRVFGEKGQRLVSEKLISNEKAHAKENFATALDHVQRGGLLLIHPTGGRERFSKTRELEFSPGFRLLLRNLPEEKMVYSFCVYPQDLAQNFENQIMAASRFAGSASEELISPKLNVNKLRRKVDVRVDEKYGTVREWKEHASNDIELTDHYWDTYAEFLGES